MKQTPVLSFIVPCYNSEKTLKESVESIFGQELESSFEVIAVDDGSTDGTDLLLRHLRQIYPQLKIVSHLKNRGGGAARNTGIQASKGTLIYCMDSDNVLDRASMKKMIKMLQTQKLDGVAFHERRFFLGTNKRLASSYMNRLGLVTLEDLFNSSNIVLDNLLFTRAAYNKIGGYPVHHDFDTQAFEVRFLANGYRVEVCEGTMIFHRQRTAQRSYFERVYERGEYSINFYLILEEIFHLFSDRVQECVIEFNVFSQAELKKNILTMLKDLYQVIPNSFFISAYSQYLGQDGLGKYVKDHKSKKSRGIEWCRAILDLREQRYVSAMNRFSACASSDSVLPYFNVLRSVIAKELPARSDRVERCVLERLSRMQLVRKQSILRRSMASLLFGKIKRSWNAGNKR